MSCGVGFSPVWGARTSYIHACNVLWCGWLYAATNLVMPAGLWCVWPQCPLCELWVTLLCRWSCDVSGRVTCVTLSVEWASGVCVTTLSVEWACVVSDIMLWVTLGWSDVRTLLSIEWACDVWPHCLLSGLVMCETSLSGVWACDVGDLIVWSHIPN